LLKNTTKLSRLSHIDGERERDLPESYPRRAVVEATVVGGERRTPVQWDGEFDKSFSV